MDKDHGDLEKWLQQVTDDTIFNILEPYGQRGVEALSQATPKDEGVTASSWSYKKVKTSSGYALEFHNSHTHDGVNIAVILQYGHGTGTGGYVAGRDYINPVTLAVFEEIADALTKEVS